MELTSQVKDFRIINEWYFFTKYWKFKNKENVCLAQLTEKQYRRASEKFAADGTVLIKKEIIYEENVNVPFFLIFKQRNPEALGWKNSKYEWKEKGVNPNWLNKFPLHLSLWWTEKGLLWANDVLFGGFSSIQDQIIQALQSGNISTLKYWKFYYSREENHYVLLWFKSYQKAKEQLDTAGAGKIGQMQGRNLWWSKQGLFWADTNTNDEEVQLLLWDRQRKHDSKLDRLRKIRAQEANFDEARRERVSDEVRAFVWERDEGRCVKCGSQEDLQFDHIIPVAKGGGNMIENVQILCGECNRQKSDNII